MKKIKYIPTAVAALALAAIALPTAAQAATPAAAAVKRPAIQQVWNTNGDYTVEHGTAYLVLADLNRVGSSNSATGFGKLDVTVTDEHGKQVCSSATSGYPHYDGWDCAFGRDALSVGEHTLRAVATNEQGVSSRPSKPVKVIVRDDAPVAPEVPEEATTVPAPGPVDQGFTAGADFSSTVPSPTGDAKVVSGSAANGWTVTSTFTGTAWASILVTDAHGTEHHAALDGDGRGQLRWDVAPGVDASFDVSQSVNGWDSAKTHVVPEAQEVVEDSTAAPAPGPVDQGFTAGEATDTTSTPAPGPIDPGFTAGETTDTTSTPAPGPVDQGFTAGSNSGVLADPTVIAEDHRYSLRTIIAQVKGTPGATIHVMDANGDKHVKTMPASGSVLMHWNLGHDDDGSFSLQLELNGAVSKTMQIVPTH